MPTSIEGMDTGSVKSILSPLLQKPAGLAEAEGVGFALTVAVIPS